MGMFRRTLNHWAATSASDPRPEAGWLSCAILSATCGCCTRMAKKSALRSRGHDNQKFNRLTGPPKRGAQFRALHISSLEQTMLVLIYACCSIAQQSRRAYLKTRRFWLGCGRTELAVRASGCAIGGEKAVATPAMKAAATIARSIISLRWPVLLVCTAVHPDKTTVPRKVDFWLRFHKCQK
jgi:hypothetical protein